MVRLTKIYTKAGDEGETSLGDGSRVSKRHPRVEAYGAVDELNAVIGAALALGGEEMPEREALAAVQNDLFDLGADLCTPLMEGEEGKALRFPEGRAVALEEVIDRVNEGLEPLKSFVLPGGAPAAAMLQVARTVCRRAEREALRLAAVEDVNPHVTVYLNRLSDLLFVLARAANRAAGTAEPLWKPGG